MASSSSTVDLFALLSEQQAREDEFQRTHRESIKELRRWITPKHPGMYAEMISKLLEFNRPRDYPYPFVQLTAEPLLMLKYVLIDYCSRDKDRALEFAKEMVLYFGTTPEIVIYAGALLADKLRRNADVRAYYFGTLYPLAERTITAHFDLAWGARSHMRAAAIKAELEKIGHPEWEKKFEVFAR